MPVAITRAKYPGNMPSRGGGFAGSGAGRSIMASVDELAQVEVQDAEVQDEATQTRQRRGHDDPVVAAQIRLHRGRQEPELEHDEHQDDDEDAGHDRQSLTPDERRPAQRMPSSTPTAKTRSPRTSSRRRGSGRRGGPSSGAPVARSNDPLWHGQWKRPRAGSGITGQDRCVHFW